MNGVQEYDGNEFSGELKDILNLEKKIVFNTLKNLGITASKSEINNINKNTTKNFEAFISFCVGLDNYDQEDYNGAISQFNQALKFDPKFRMAYNKLNMTQALKIVQQGTFQGKHKAIMGKRFASARGMRRGPRMGMRGKNFVRFRLQQVARNLDLGYLPGNDSRNGSAEIINEDVFDQLPEWTRKLELLPEPPKPPVPPNSH